MSLARIFLVVLLLLTSVVRGEAVDQKPVPQEAPAPPPSRVIPLAEVASRATEVEAFLRAYQALHAFTPAGLILLFERPIHVGDTIEAGGITGSVRRIGIRSSVVRTGQGAEVIVPNAQLVTERVTNWTLSDRQRRIELPVGVSYSAHPKRVMEMLEMVGQAHPQVLRQPAPRAFFTSFGDSSINFELRAWTDQFDQWFQIRSELASAVYDAGQAAGIAFPFPRREVRLLHDAPGGSATPAKTAGQTAGTPRGSAS